MKLMEEHRRVVAELERLRGEDKSSPASHPPGVELLRVLRPPVCPPKPGRAPEASRSFNMPFGSEPGGVRVLSVPSVLRSRRSQAGEPPKARKAVENFVSGRGSARSPVEMESHWVDLYLANEAAAEVAESERKGRRRSLSDDYPMKVFVHRWRKKVPFRPHDRTRFFWDLLGWFLILYQLVMVPVDLACFGPHQGVGLGPLLLEVDRREVPSVVTIAFPEEESIAMITLRLLKHLASKANDRR